MSDNRLRVLIEEDGVIHVKLDMPHGRTCDRTDARFRALSKLMGLRLEDETEHPDRIPNAHTQREKERA